MSSRKAKQAIAMTFQGLLKKMGPGESLEILRKRQDADAEWAERAMAGEEPLGEAIRIQRGRPKAGERVPETVVKAVRLPIHLLEKLQAQAKAQGLSLNALLQMAAAEYLAHHRSS